VIEDPSSLEESVGGAPGAVAAAGGPAASSPGSDDGLFQYLAVKVDVQVEPLSTATGIELERRFGSAEFELVIAL
jgi:hypothetical protein